MRLAAGGGCGCTASCREGAGLGGVASWMGEATVAGGTVGGVEERGYTGGAAGWLPGDGQLDGRDGVVVIVVAVGDGGVDNQR